MAVPTHLTCVDIHGDEHIAATSELGWRPSVYGILIQDGAVLLTRQFGKHGLPGGGMDFGEIPEQTLVREVKEETGILVVNPRLFSVQSDLFKLPHLKQGGFVQSIQLFYVCDFGSGELSIEGFDDHEQQHAEVAQWVSLSAVDETPMYGSCDFRAEIKKAAAI